MISPTFNINKSFKDKMTKCMKTIFFAITQPHISTVLAKKNTRVLASLMFYETRKNPRKVLKGLSCVIYAIISNYVCIYYLASEFKKNELPIYYGWGFKHEDKSYDKILEIGFQIC